MAEYLGAVVVMSATLGIISYVSYPQGSEKTVKFAASVLLLYTAITPLLSFVIRISNGEISGIVPSPDYSDSEMSDEDKEVAESAFKEGISKLLLSKYGIKAENAEIYVIGFDFQKMRADKIKITLSGSGAISDFRGIESYITESGLGDCEVNLEIG